MFTARHIFAAMLVSALAWSAPAAAQEVRIGLASEPTAMDPHFHNLSPNNSLLSHIFEALVDQDERQRMIPGLAESWKAIDDTTWEFKLRRDARFHDGTPFTADDVVFTFERAPNVEGSPSSFGTYVKGKTVVKVDDHTVHIKTAEPYPLMPNDVSQVFIISKKHGSGAKTSDYNSGKAGSAPGRSVSASTRRETASSCSATSSTGASSRPGSGWCSARSSPTPRAWRRCSRATSTSSTKCPRPTWSV
jgi:peptide/nickel transport system substrate-binding protein